MDFKVYLCQLHEMIDQLAEAKYGIKPEDCRLTRKIKEAAKADYIKKLERMSEDELKTEANKLGINDHLARI